jgi:hypothetical protein
MIATDQRRADTSALSATANKGWARFLLPSVRDLVFLVSFWALLIGPLSSRPLADADIGWHIRTGEQILATHSVPRVDSFSSTMQGQPWFAWEWLYDTLLGVVHESMGLNGVVWLGALLMSTAFAVLFWQLLARGTGLPVALLLWLLVLGASSIHVFARPHIVSWLFTLLWFVALERWEQGNAPPWLRWEQGNAPPWLRWFFPVSMLLWVNLHGGWLLGMALLAIYMVAAFVESLRGSDAIARILSAHRARSMAWTFVASAVATVVNPYDVRLHAHIYRYLSDPYLVNRIAEFRSPDFHGWGQRCFVVILVLVLIAFAGNRGKMRVSHWLVVVLSAWIGVYAVRNLPVSAMLLTLIAGPLLWESVAGLAERPGAWGTLRRGAGRLTGFAARAGTQELQLRGHLWPLLGVIAVLAICLNGGRVGSQRVIQKEFDATRLPASAVDYLEREGSAQPVFGPDQWGGYLIYRLYQRRKVVIDDRHDLYGSARFREYLILMQGEPGWKDVLEKWQIRTVVLPPGSTLANLLKQIPQQWQTVYQDNAAVIMKRQSEGDL